MSSSVPLHPTPTMTPVVPIATSHPLMTWNFRVRPLLNKRPTIRCLTSWFPTRLPHEPFLERRLRIPQRWNPTRRRLDQPVRHPHQLRIHLRRSEVRTPHRLRCRHPAELPAVHLPPAANRSGQHPKRRRLPGRRPKPINRRMPVDRPIPGRRQAPVNLKAPDDPNLPAVRSPREHRQTQAHLRTPDKAIPERRTGSLATPRQWPTQRARWATSPTELRPSASSG